MPQLLQSSGQISMKNIAYFMGGQMCNLRLTTNHVDDMGLYTMTGVNTSFSSGMCQLTNNPPSTTVNSYVTSLSFPTVDYFSGLTLLGTFKFSSSPSASVCLLSMNSNIGYGILLTVESGTSLRATLYNQASATMIVSAAFTPIVGTLYTIAATVSGCDTGTTTGTLTLFLNNAQVGQSSTFSASTSALHITSLEIGRTRLTSAYSGFDGQVSGVKVWARALTASDLTSSGFGLGNFYSQSVGGIPTSGTISLGTFYGKMGILVTNGLVGKFTGDSVLLNNVLYDDTGTSNATTVGCVRTGSTWNNRKYLTGGPLDGITFPVWPTTYTVFHVTRYNGVNKGRIFDGFPGNNLISGHNGGRSGVCYHNNWIAPYVDVFGSTWVLSTDQLSLYKGNGTTLSTGAAGAMPVAYQMGINTGFYKDDEPASWALAAILVYNRQLTASEILQVEGYLSDLYDTTLMVTPSNYFGGIMKPLHSSVYTVVGGDMSLGYTQMNVLGTPGSKTALYAYRAIQKASFVINFEVFVQSSSTGDFMCLDIGVDNPSDIMSSGPLNTLGFSLHMMTVSGLIILYTNTGQVAGQFSFGSTLADSLWHPVQLVYTLGVSNTWRVMFNGSEVITYSDPSNSSWVGSSGQFWGFGCSCGANTSGTYRIRNVSNYPSASINRNTFANSYTRVGTVTTTDIEGLGINTDLTLGAYTSIFCTRRIQDIGFTIEYRMTFNIGTNTMASLYMMIGALTGMNPSTSYNVVAKIKDDGEPGTTIGLTLTYQNVNVQSYAYSFLPGVTYYMRVKYTAGSGVWTIALNGTNVMSYTSSQASWVSSGAYHGFSWVSSDWTTTCSIGLVSVTANDGPIVPADTPSPTTVMTPTTWYTLFSRTQGKTYTMEQGAPGGVTQLSLLGNGRGNTTILAYEYNLVQLHEMFNFNVETYFAGAYGKLNFCFGAQDRNVSITTGQFTVCLDGVANVVTLYNGTGTQVAQSGVISGGFGTYVWTKLRMNFSAVSGTWRVVYNEVPVITFSDASWTSWMASCGPYFGVWAIEPVGTPAVYGVYIRNVNVSVMDTSEPSISGATMSNTTGQISWNAVSANALELWQSSGVSSTGLVSSFGFEGNATDTLGNTVCTTTGVAYTQTRNLFGNQCLFLTGTAGSTSPTQFISGTILPRLDLQQGLTISVWVRPIIVASSIVVDINTILRMQTFSAFTWSGANQTVTNFTGWAVCFFTGTMWYIAKVAGLVPETWVNLVYLCSGGNTHTLFVNGVQGDSFVYRVSEIELADFSISRYAQFNGCIDNLLMWNRALSVAEIRVLAQPSGMTSQLSSPPTQTYLDALPTTVSTLGQVSNIALDGNLTDSLGNVTLVGTNVGYSTSTNLTQTRSCLFFTGATGPSAPTQHATSTSTPVVQSNLGITISLWVRPISLANTIPLELGLVIRMYTLVNWSGTVLNASLTNFTGWMVWIYTPSGSWYGVQFAGLQSEMWVYLVYRYDAASTTHTMFVNGIQGDSLVVSMAYPTLAGLKIGPHYQFNGCMSNVQIWNRALGTAEITALYTNLAPVMTISSGTAASLSSWQSINVSTTRLVANIGLNGNALDTLGNYVFDVIGGMTFSTTVTLFDRPTLLFTAAPGGAVTQYLQTSAMPALICNQGFSVSMWVRPGTLASVGCLFDLGGNARLQYYSNSGYGFINENITNLTGWVWMCLNSTNTNWFASKFSGGLTTNVWAHIVVVYTGTMFTMYVNGVQGNSVNCVVSVATLTQATFSPAAQYNGCVSNVQIWNRPLSSAEAASLFTNGATVASTSAVVTTRAPPVTSDAVCTTSTSLAQIDVWQNLGVSSAFLMSNIGFYGNVSDSLGNITLATTGSPVYSSSVNLFGTSCLNFTATPGGGVSQMVQSTSMTPLLSNQGFSASMWTRPGTLASVGGLFDLGGNARLQYYSNSGYGFINENITNLTGWVWMCLNSTNTDWFASKFSGGLTTNVWAHIVVVYTGTLFTMYVNGVQGNSVNCVVSVATLTQATFSPGAQYNGCVSNVQIWNRPLSSSEALALYMNGAVVATTSVTQSVWSPQLTTTVPQMVYTTTLKPKRSATGWAQYGRAVPMIYLAPSVITSIAVDPLTSTLSWSIGSSTFSHVRYSFGRQNLLGMVSSTTGTLALQDNLLTSLGPNTQFVFSVTPVGSTGQGTTHSMSVTTLGSVSSNVAVSSAGTLTWTPYSGQSSLVGNFNMDGSLTDTTNLMVVYQTGNGLLSSYSLDGDFTDSQGFVSLFNLNATVTFDRTNVVNGVSSALFNGTSSALYATLPNAVSLTIGFSVSFWIRPTLLNNVTRVIFELVLSGVPIFNVTIKSTTNCVYIGMRQHAGAWFGDNNSNVVLVANTWYHIVATFTPGGTSKLYINASNPYTSGPYNGATYTSYNYINVGHEFQTFFFPGNMDNLEVWSRELSAAEISTLYSRRNYTSIVPRPECQVFRIGETYPSSQLCSFTFDSLTLTDSLNKLMFTRRGTGVSYDTVAHKFGTACLQLNGTTGYIGGFFEGSSVSLTRGFSVSLWVNLTSVATSQSILCMSTDGTAGNSAFELQFTAGSGFMLYVYKSPGVTWSSEIPRNSASVVAGTWYHVVATLTAGGSSKLYVNNNVPSGQSYPAPTLTSVSYVCVGSRYGTSLFFGGDIDHVQMWARELVMDEVAALFFSPAALANAHTLTPIGGAQATVITNASPGTSTPGTQYIVATLALPVVHGLGFTVAFNVNFTSVGAGYSTLFEFTTPGGYTDGISIQYVPSTGFVAFNIIGGALTGTPATCAVIAATGLWYRVLLVYRTSGSTLYINGTTGATLSQANPAFSSQIFGRFILGARGAQSFQQSFNGQIDDIRLWNVPMLYPSFYPSREDVLCAFENNAIDMRGNATMSPTGVMYNSSSKRFGGFSLALTNTIWTTL